jgi:hypothetical protein
MNTLPREALKFMRAKRMYERHIKAPHWHRGRCTKWSNAYWYWQRRFDQLIARTLYDSEIPGALTLVG